MKKAPRRKHWARMAMADRDALHATNPSCHWCGKTTFLGKGNGDLLATLDHVKSWPESSSLEEWNSRENKVLACRGCNQRRSAEWCAANH